MGKRAKVIGTLLLLVGLASAPVRAADPLSDGEALDRVSTLPQATAPEVLARKAKYRAQVRKDPSAADAFLYLGQEYMWQGAPACRVAMGLFERAIAAAKQDWIKAQAQGRIGQCLDYLDRKAEAQAAYREVIAKYPDTPWAEEVKNLIPGARRDQAGDDGEALFRQGERAFEAKRHEEALRLFLQAADAPVVEGSGIPPNALLMAGIQCDWLAKEKRDASFIGQERTILQKLIDAYPASSRVADAYLYLGQTYSGHAGAAVKPDCPKALALYKKAIETADRDWIKAQARGRMGQCLDSMGRKDEARAAYQEIKAKYPETPWAAEAEGLLAR